MLKLREIELLGFKSFADRTRLVCDGSTVAIVGPNGCGKSNLADAVSWVLGEQSARMLRGERMSDVIFNGAGGRQPIGMAEVSITLTETEDQATGTGSSMKASETPPASHAESSDANAESEYPAVRAKRDLTCLPGEIKVTRRLFRSGESEYLLNGETCRLRDIQDIFMGTGLGPESYAIIEQGRIGQILSSKPSDRRAIIEEAAGVSKFKSRKRLAEAKLESSRQNLARIHDILEEISKQVNSLKRQASKAARYRELQQDLRSRQRRVFASRLIALEGQCGKLRQNLAVIQEECARAMQRLETLDRERAAAALRYEQLEEEFKPLREQLLTNELEAERLRSRLEMARQQREVLESRAGEAEQERIRLENQAQRLEEQARELADGAERLRLEWSDAKENVAQWASRQAEIASQLTAREAEVEFRRRDAVSAVSRAAELRNQMVKAEEMSASLERQLDRVESEREAAEENSRRFSAELEAVEVESRHSEELLSGLSQAVAQSEAALDRTWAEESATHAAVEELGHAISQASARKQALEESLARHAYSTESVRRLLSASEVDFRPLGLLADFLEVAPGYEEIVEEFLKAELDCVVVEGYDQVRGGIALLRNEGSGRSAFFVRNFSSNGHGNGMRAPESSLVRPQPGVVASFEELVRFEPRLGLNGDVAFPILSTSFVVEDAAAAERLSAAYPFCHFVTLKGEHYHHRLVAGGKGASAGPLALRRDFRDLERRVAELQSALTQAEEHWAAARSLLGDAEEKVRRLTAEKLSAEKQSVLASEKLRQARESAQQSAERVASLRHESAMLAEERNEIGRRSDALRAELESARAEQQQSELQANAAVGAARALRAELDHVSQTLTTERVKAGALEERWRAAEADRSRVDSEGIAAREKLARLTAQARAWDDERRRLEGETDDIQHMLAEAEARHQELGGQLRAREEESRRSRAQRDDLQPQVEAARATLDLYRDKKSEAEVILARAESDLSHHLHQCREELASEPESLREEMSTEDLLEGKPLQEAEAELREIKDRIERLGPVNMMALEELQEAEERLNFLETQRQDLLASINDTMQTIRKIDDVSRRKFVDAFEVINGFFAETFRTLFGGGVGEMRFSDEADPESGIDLVAQPPGKRLQNVLLLSGGEKALTALALLIAVFRFTPSPFCILDEVDAPLDESNVVRFTRLIDQMSEKTQFILVTHNKRTMEVCRTLYGVTMQEPGVSKLVSVKFEAKEPEPVAVPA